MAKMKDQHRKKSRSDREALLRPDPGHGNGHTSEAIIPGIAYAEELHVDTLTASDFDGKQLREAYRTMLLARRLDEKMLTLLKQGKGFFHAGCAGHEAAQAAIGMYVQPGHDWFCMYYRDLCISLAVGMTARDTLLAHLAKADDPSSGGRQMSQHYGVRELNILAASSSVGSQFLPALGFAMAVQRRGEDAFVYVSAGEGATSQGAFHEALNWASRIKAPMLFFIQDNKFAISVPVEDQIAGGTPYKLAAGYEGLKRIRVDGTDFFKMAAASKHAIEHIRTGQGPVCLVTDVVRLFPHSSSDNHAKYRSSEELSEAQEIDPLLLMEMTLIEEGVLDAHSVEEMEQEIRKELEEAAAWALEQSDPTPESATRYVLFEGDPGIDYEASEPTGDPMVMVDAVNAALKEEMARDEQVIVYGEDVAGEKGGVFKATRDLTDLFGPDRCFNSPLAEASVVGTAMGLAASGYKPVVEIQFADYIWPAMQHIRNQVASLRYRSNNKWSCPMVIRVPCGGYIHGGLYHSQNIEAMFAHFPGLKVAMPSIASDAKGLLKTAIRSQDPILFLEHKALYRLAAARTPVADENGYLPFGKARVAREGSDLTIVTWGMIVHKATHAANRLEREDDVSVEIIDIRTMLPLDMETILASVKKTNRALIAYEDHEFMGFGAEIAARIADEAFALLDAPVRRLAGEFTFIPFSGPLEKAVLPQDEDIYTAARGLLDY